MFLKKTLPLILLGFLLIFCAWIQISYMVPTTGGTDQNGYHICAQRFLKDGVFWQKPVDDLQFIGSMWVVNERGEFYPKYPPLYPVLITGMNALFGHGAGFYLTSIGLLISIAGIFVLGTFFSGRWGGFAAAFILACSPVVEVLGFTRNSHTPSLAFLLWGLNAFFYGVVRRRHGWSFFWVMVSGVLIGYTIGIRYTDFLLIFIPISYLLCFYHGKRSFIHLAALLFGAMIPYAAMGAFHWAAYGAPWRSGYSLTGESGAFQFGFMLDNLQIYIPLFCTVLAGPACATAVFAGCPRWKRGIFWGVWILPTFLLYLSYYWAPLTENTGTMRFVVPVLPPVILLSVIAMRKIGNTFSFKSVLPGLILLLAVHGIWGWSWITRWGESKAAGDLTNLVLVQEALRRIPAGSCIIAGENFLNELDFEQRWHLYSPSLFAPNEIRNKIKRSLEKQAAGLHPARAKALEKKLGKLNYGQLYRFWRDFFEQQQKQGHEVWFIARNWEINRFLRIFGPYFEFESRSLSAGMREPWIIREIKRDASRYYTQDKPVALPRMEFVKLGRKRKMILPRQDRIRLLQYERNELFSLLNPKRDQTTGELLNRLENNRAERDAEYRAAADEKRRAEFRKRQRALNEKRRLEKLRRQRPVVFRRNPSHEIPFKSRANALYSNRKILKNYAAKFRKEPVFLRYLNGQSF